MAQFQNNLSADPEVSANRKIRIISIMLNALDGTFGILYQVFYKTGANSDLKINSRFPPVWYYISNETRVTTSGNQFLGDNSRNPAFGLRIPSTDPAYATATPEYDFIKSKLEVAAGAGKIDLLDYAVREIQALDAAGFFNN